MNGMRTESLCPVCLDRIPAIRAIDGEEVFLEKTCPRHGRFRTLIWKGPPLFETWRRPKIPVYPSLPFRTKEKGCPFDCGLCPDHRQRSCTVILEVTRRCDLGCPVCYADAKTSGDDPSLATIAGWYRSVRMGSGNGNIQISGGEPTLRDDLAEILALGREHGFSFLQINTNGIRIARDRAYLSALKQAGLSSVFLQFDGTEDAIYRRMRGRNLLDDKLSAVEACGDLGIGVVLVPTLVPGWNTENVGRILELALTLLPVVRAVHFQPVSRFGRFPRNLTGRLTLPELMRSIEIQTEGLFRAGHFRPPGCENALCSFHAQYLVTVEGNPVPLHPEAPLKEAPDPIPAEVGAERAIQFVAREWAGRKPEKSPSPSCCGDRALKLDDFLVSARTRVFSVSAMAFQDAWSLDIDRVRDCCIHVVSGKGDLVPFCLHNLTSASGRLLYPR
ncbi:MAG: radical SAM (seleno)protein TrsS [Desulfobacterales bacterium]